MVASGGRKGKGLTMFSLTVYRGDKLVQELDFDSAEVTIGRKPDNAVVLPDDGKGVSRVHAILKVENGEFVLYDGNSRNGTFVDGKPIKRVAIYPGQDFVVGPYRLILGASDTVESAPTMVATRISTPPLTESSHTGSSGQVRSSEGSTKSRLPAPPQPVSTGSRQPASTPVPMAYLAAGAAAVFVLGAVLIWQLWPASEPAPEPVVQLSSTTTIPETTTSIPEAPPPDPYAERMAQATAAMDAAENTLAAKNFRGAAREYDRLIKEYLAPILAEDATYAPAIELEARAKTRAAEAMSLAPAIVKPTAPEPPKPGPNDVAVRQGESREDYERRNKEANTDYELGRRYLSEGNFLDASKLFADLATREPGWRDVSTYARNSQESLDKERRRAVDEGLAHDNVGFKAANASNLAAAATEYLAARKAYERAAALQDPQAQKLLAGNLERRRALAQSALAEAQTHLNYRNRTEARKWLLLVNDLLPAGEPIRKQAESYLAKLAPGL
jgi:pSer/pThr/pTyr-binding forkhead associated (FHA) protein